jgi:hypothetical protein
MIESNLHLIVSLDVEAVERENESIPSVVTGIGLYMGIYSQGKNDVNSPNFKHMTHYKKKKWWIKLPEDFKISKKQMNEFWDKHPDVYKQMIETENEEQSVIRDFIKSFDSAIRTFTPDEIKNVVLISDNPLFDFGMLDKLIDKYKCRGFPLRYTTTGRYRSVFSITDSAYFGNYFQTIDDKIKSHDQNIVHDHSPDNDAQYLAFFHLEVVRAQKMLGQIYNTIVI